MPRLLITLILALTIGALPVDAAKPKPARTVNTVKKEKQGNQQKIKDTQQRLSDNKRKTARELDNLNSLRADLDRSEAALAGMKMTVDSIDRHIVGVSDSLRRLEAKLDSVKADYVASMRRMQGTSRKMGRLSFILSAKSFKEAYRRIRYLGEVNRWRRRQAERITEVADELKRSRNRLAELQGERSTALKEIRTEHDRRQSIHDAKARVVDDLRKQGADLTAELEAQRKRSLSLDNELDRLIAQQQQQQQERRKQKQKEKQKPSAPAATAPSKPGKKPEPAKPQPAAPSAPSTSSSSGADLALTGSFESNKGRLLFPVPGSYKVVKKFGRQHHPDLPNIVTDNPGVDIEVSSGSKARAVFAGKVSAIFRQDGFNNIVMVRHGDYITIYANLSGIAVRTGDTVKAGQSLGTIATDNGHTILHFEVRREKAKLNPLAWVR